MPNELSQRERREAAELDLAREGQGQGQGQGLGKVRRLKGRGLMTVAAGNGRVSTNT